jgi:hypothetical protein
VHLKRFLVSWHPNDQRLLFVTRNGTPWDQNMVLKRRFKPLLAAVGIKVPRGDGFYILSSRECDVDEQLRHSSEIAPTTSRARRWFADHGVGLHPRDSEDGKRVAAQLGDAVWGVLDARTEKKNGSEVESPKPLCLQ